MLRHMPKSISINRSENPYHSGFINTAAQEEGINFSKTLQEALMSKLKAH